jgi:single-stranded DNA-binding protein
MKSQFNNVVMVGNIGKEPVCKSTKAGNNLTSFSLGVWQGKEKPTMWLMVKTLEPVYAGKGAKVRVEGRLTFEQYQATNGEQRVLWGVWADSVEAIEAPRPASPVPQMPDDDESCPF